jgi:hypothetical protein
MKFITVARDDIELISAIEAMGTWEKERWLVGEHDSYDIWTFNGNVYKIYKDSARYPKYIKSADGYIGVFKRLAYGEFPVYRFPGGERIADNWEIENGSDNREDLV